MIGVILKVLVALPGFFDLANRLLDMIDSWKRTADAQRELLKTQTDDADVVKALENAKTSVNDLNSKWNGD